MNRQFFPGYSIGTDAYDDIKKICKTYGKTAAIIGGKQALDASQEKILAAMEGSGVEPTGIFWYGGEASVENIELLENNPTVAKADMIFAVGGGKAIDTGKVLAHRTGRPFFTFPTIASTCASCTSLGILYHPDGSLREYSFSKDTPIHIFIDSEVISHAPREYLWAGIGDTMAKFYECTISGRGDTLSHSEALGTAISTMCADPLVAYGVQALHDCDNNHVSSELEEVILGIIISTGFVSNLVSIDYNTGLAHAVYNGFTILPQIEKYGHLHGEIVFYGILILLLVDRQMQEFGRIYQFGQEMGFPTCLESLHTKIEQTHAVADKALQGIDVRHYPYTVTQEMILSAISELENYHSQQK